MCKILPLGDSITEGMQQTGGGYQFNGGYRVELFRLATEAGHEITFTGSATANGPTTVAGQPFPRNHEGHSGWTIEQIDGQIPNPALNEDPHIILLHIGTNNFGGFAGPADTAQSAAGKLETLIDNILDESPSSLLAVSSIIPFPLAQGSTVTGYNSLIEGLVQTRADMGFHIIFVDQYEGFPTSELPDSVHPNESGYARMGAKWYEAIESYLN